MRLIDVETYEIREFFGGQIPEYAILSHTWGAEEVTFQDMTRLHAAGKEAFNGPDGLYFQISSKEGYEKIMYTCRQAREDKLAWAWVDTCCIDKTSSSELSEAINSMYQWYENSKVCYAYLLDVPHQSDSDHIKWPTIFQASRWFTRGWTLQELIAPASMLFYGQNWSNMGSRDDLVSHISTITRIPEHAFHLRRRYFMEGFSVGQKMSWAATRECTRIEDTAYCLLGIFDINMPLLYGEGKKAFRRLQEEIFRSTDDHSLLAWTSDIVGQHWHPGSVFASSPRNFSRCGNIIRLHEEVGAPSLVTKKGLQMSLHFEEATPLTWRQYRQAYALKTFHAVLNCAEKPEDSILQLSELKDTLPRIILLLAKDSGEDDRVQQSQCYSRIITQTHLGSQGGRPQYEDPSEYQTIFLRTHNHRQSYFWSPGETQKPSVVQIHAHNIAFEAKEGEQMKEVDPEQVMGYSLKSATYHTDSMAGYHAPTLDLDKITIKGTFFILSMLLESKFGLPPLEARIGFEGNGPGRGHVRLSLGTKSEVRPSKTGQASQYVKIQGYNGELLAAFLKLPDLIFAITLRSHYAWEDTSSQRDDRVHLHIHASFLPISSVSTISARRELSQRTWNAREFWKLFEKSEVFLENEKKNEEKRLADPEYAKLLPHVLALESGEHRRRYPFAYDQPIRAPDHGYRPYDYVPPSDYDYIYASRIPTPPPRRYVPPTVESEDE